MSEHHVTDLPILAYPGYGLTGYASIWIPPFLCYTLLGGINDPFWTPFGGPKWSHYRVK